jgi:PncC family amidohydrolase
MTAAERLIERCRATGRTVATAESCTGGLLGARLTAAPGASAGYAGGVVCYSNAAKRTLLGVPADLLSRCGAVSAETAAAMAEGARRVLHTDAAVAVTGIAGPGGGSVAKPAGTVFIATTSAAGTRVARHHWSGGRATVRNAACRAALQALASALELGLEIG